MKKIVMLCSALVLGVWPEAQASLWEIEAYTNEKEIGVTSKTSLVAITERMNKLNSVSTVDAKRVYRWLYDYWLSDPKRWSNDGKKSTFGNIQGYVNQDFLVANEDETYVEDKEGNRTYLYDWTNNFNMMLKKIENLLPTAAANNGVEIEDEKTQEQKDQDAAAEAAQEIHAGNLKTNYGNKVIWDYTFKTDTFEPNGHDGYIETDKNGNPILRYEAQKRIESELLAQKQANKEEIAKTLLAQEQALETGKQTNEAELRSLRIYNDDGTIKKNEKGKECVNEKAVQWIDKKITEAKHEVAVDAEEQTARHELELSKAQVLTNLKAAINEMAANVGVESPNIDNLTEFDLALLSKIMKEVGVDVDEDFIVGMKRVWKLSALNMSYATTQNRVGKKNVDPDKWGNPQVIYTYEEIDPNAITNADIAILLLDHFCDTDTVKESGKKWDLSEKNNLTDLLKEGRELAKKYSENYNETAESILRSVSGIETKNYNLDTFIEALKKNSGDLANLMKKCGLNVEGWTGSLADYIKAQYIGEGENQIKAETIAEFILKSYGIVRHWKDIENKIIEKYVVQSDGGENKILERTLINLLNWKADMKRSTRYNKIPKDRDENEPLALTIIYTYGDSAKLKQAVEGVLSNNTAWGNTHPFGEPFSYGDYKTLEEAMINAYSTNGAESQKISVAVDIISKASDKKFTLGGRTLKEAILQDFKDKEKEEDEELSVVLSRVLGVEFDSGVNEKDGSDLATSIIEKYGEDHGEETVEIILSRANTDPNIEFTRNDGEDLDKAILRIFGKTGATGLNSIAWDIAEDNLGSLGDKPESINDLGYEVVNAYSQLENKKKETAEAILSSVPRLAYGNCITPIERETGNHEELPSFSLEYEIVNTYSDPYKAGETLGSILKDNFNVVVEQETLEDAILNKKTGDEGVYDVLSRITGQAVTHVYDNTLESDIVVAFPEKAVGYVIKEKTGIEVEEKAQDFDDDIISAFAKNAFIKNVLMKKYGVEENGEIYKSFNKMKFHLNLVARTLQKISAERDVSELTPEGVKTRAIWFHSFRQYMLQSFRDAVPLIRLAYTVNHDKWWNSLLP